MYSLSWRSHSCNGDTEFHNWHRWHMASVMPDLSSCRESLPFCWYQIILLGEKALAHVWNTCPRLLPKSRSQTLTFNSWVQCPNHYTTMPHWKHLNNEEIRPTDYTLQVNYLVLASKSWIKASSTLSVSNPLTDEERMRLCCYLGSMLWVSFGTVTLLVGWKGSSQNKCRNRIEGEPADWKAIKMEITIMKWCQNISRIT